MTNNKTIDKILLVLFCVLFAFFGASGSIYFNSKIIGIAKIDVALILMVASAIWCARSMYLTLTKELLWIMVLAIVFFINNATTISIHDFPMLLLYPTILFLVLISFRLTIDWYRIEINILKAIYIFYAIYTILMRLNPIFVRIVVDFFPGQSSKERILQQYNDGCMPGFTTHYSTNGMLLAVGAILFFSEYIYRRKLIDAVWSLLFTVAILLTGKRAHAIFTFMAVFIGYYVNESADKKNRRTKMLLILIVTLVALYIVVQYIPALSTFIVRFAETEEEGDVTLGRTEVWTVAISVFKNNPIIGIGWGQFMNQGYWKFNAHNIYVQLLCETGIIGSAVYFCFFGYMLVKTWKLLKDMRENKETTYATRLLLFSLSYQIFFILYGFTGNPLYEQIMYIPYLFSCSITFNAMKGRLQEANRIEG